MWEKIFRKENSLVYRRRYKCPMCGEYTLLLIHDKACECKNSCDVNESNIEYVKNKNDYEGYFTKEEITDGFWIDYDEMDTIIKDCIIRPPATLITEKENESLWKIFEHTDGLDNKVDELVIKYLNFYNLNEVEQYNPYCYLISLLEDLLYYINLSCKDIVLFEVGVSQAKSPNNVMYSGRFFYNNAVDHFFQANERLFVIFGIIYNFDFKEDLIQNKTPKIKKFIKKNENYKCFFDSYILKLNSNNFYRELKDIRDSNEHALSYMNRKIILEEDKEKWNIDGDEADKILYLPIIKNIIFCLDIFNDIFNIIVEKIDNKELYNLNSFPMFTQFLKWDDNFKFKKYDIEFYKKIENYNKKFLLYISGFAGNDLIKDIYFRLDETVHCIRDIYNNLNNSLLISMMNFNGFIEIDYIIYSAITRIYSCYDKVSLYIASMYKEYEKVEHFQDFADINNNQSAIMRSINNILMNKEYLKLQELRNNIYHNLRAGVLYGDDGFDYYNIILTQVIFENVLMLYELLDKIRPIKRGKINRNNPCYCGSKKKYKYCCGKITN